MIPASGRCLERRLVGSLLHTHTHTRAGAAHALRGMSCARPSWPHVTWFLSNLEHTLKKTLHTRRRFDHHCDAPHCSVTTRGLVALSRTEAPGGLRSVTAAP